MEKAETLVMSNGLVEIFIFKPTIHMSDKDCIEIAIKILNNEKAEIEEKLTLEREKAIKEIDDILKHD